jgi:hypothetical protein
MRVLVASDGPCPAAALRHASAMAAGEGEVVLVAVVVVPHAVPLEAAPEGAVASACAMLDRGERIAGARTVDTRLVRARSFAEGVLGLIDGERVDAVVVEAADGPRAGARAQLETLIERCPAELVLVRPARGATP